MTGSSASILERFRRGSSRDIDLTLRKPYLDLLAKLGNPHLKLPPVVHVAGTNGKGSTCAFLRAIAEASGRKAHVYTSPHLVTFHERIRVAGELIPENELAVILGDCERLAEPGGITYFEAGTAAAFLAFAQHHADVAIVETGLGGRLDATNVIPAPAATAITRLSFDHRDYLGHTMAGIAQEKAGIMRPHVPCFAAFQPSAEARDSLRQAAATLNAPLFMAEKDWRAEAKDKEHFTFQSRSRVLTLPVPALAGRHQIDNAGLAIAATEALPFDVTEKSLQTAMRKVFWPARLQRLSEGRLAAALPPGWELWLDGGHNDSAGEVLARHMESWQQEDGPGPKPLFLVLGMLSTKNPAEFLAPVAPFVESCRTVGIDHEPLGLPAEDLAAIAETAGIKRAAPSSDVKEALRALAGSGPQLARILICGSLYLAGTVLAENGPAA